MLAASCTLGPNYERPIVETPPAYRGQQAAAATGSLADLAWFELFRDDTLTQLVRTALQQNFELRIAAERVLQARAAYGITRADQVPSVDASADLAAVRQSQRGANPGIPAGADTDVSYVEAGFSVGWELDVWGRAAAAERSGTRAVPRDGGGAARCDHDARRGRQRDVPGVARARSRAGDCPADA